MNPFYWIVSYFWFGWNWLSCYVVGFSLSSAAEFVVYKLKEMGKISDEDVSIVMEEFRNIDVDQSGTLTASDLIPNQSSQAQCWQTLYGTSIQNL